MIFARGALSLGGFDQAEGEQGHNGFKDLLATGLSTQHSSSLFHLIALLSAAMPGSADEMALHVLPGWPGPRTGEEVEVRPQLRDHLVNRHTACIQQTERRCLQLVGQTDRERK